MKHEPLRPTACIRHARSKSASPLGQNRAVSLDDEAAQDLAAARLGDGVGDHGAAPQFLKGRHALVDEPHNLRLAQRLAGLGDDVRARQLARDLVQSGDDRGVGDLGVRAQEVLELRRRDLVR